MFVYGLNFNPFIPAIANCKMNLFKEMRHSKFLIFVRYIWLH